MAAFFEYARNITYYLLFAALVSMAAPGGKYQNYIKLVMGLVMICLVLQPLQAFSKAGLPITQLFAGIVPVPSEEGDEFTGTYEAWRYQALQTAFEEQLYLQLASLLRQEGYTLEDAGFTYAEDFSRVTYVRVTVKASEPQTTQRPFIYIAPVQTGAEEEDESSAAVKKIISDFYNLDAAHIDVRVRT